MKISIFRNNVWAGDGNLVDGEITNCSAMLGKTQDDSNETYKMIEDMINSFKNECTEVIRKDGVYSWKLYKLS